MKWIEFKVRMPIHDDQEPGDGAAELLRYGVGGVEQGVEIVEGSAYEIQISTPGSYRLARGILSNSTGESGAEAIRRIRGE